MGELSVRRSRHELKAGDRVTLRYGQSGTVTEVRDDRERSIKVELAEGVFLVSSIWEVIEWETALEEVSA